MAVADNPQSAQRAALEAGWVDRFVVGLPACAGVHAAYSVKSAINVAISQVHLLQACLACECCQGSSSANHCDEFHYDKFH